MSDVLNWIIAMGTAFGAVGTVAAFVVAFLQIRTERKARKLLEKTQAEQQVRDQAERVSAWVDAEVGGGKYAIIAILNSSNEPIFHVIVYIVKFDYNATSSSDGLDTQNSFRGFVSIIPPGKTLIKVNGGYRGMSFQPAVAIAFVDKAHRYWVRKGNGELVSLPINPVDYYKLSKPLGWQLPKTTEELNLNE